MNGAIADSVYRASCGPDGLGFDNWQEQEVFSFIQNPSAQL